MAAEAVHVPHLADAARQCTAVCRDLANARNKEFGNRFGWLGKRVDEELCCGGVGACTAPQKKKPYRLLRADDLHSRVHCIWAGFTPDIRRSVVTIPGLKLWMPTFVIPSIFNSACNDLPSCTRPRFVAPYLHCQ
jgi:hypothetical protein